MTYQGHIVNGAVVFDEPTPFPEGTKVRVEADVIPLSGFWESCSIDDLARRQGIPAPQFQHGDYGFWPEDELNDGFEAEVRAWRNQERNQHPFATPM